MNYFSFNLKTLINYLGLFSSQSLIWLSIYSTSMLFSSSATAETISGQLGNVRAEISYQKSAEYQYKNLRLKIMRADKTVLEQQFPQESEFDRPVVDLGEEKALPIVDLDGDEEPEVIADFFTRGAHCCTYSLIYRYDPAQNSYTSVQHFWGNVGYRFRDLNKDGINEFNSADDRFAYAFASYAASGFPLQIWQYQQGKMIDITRRHSQQIYSNAFENWQYYRQARQQGYEVKGFLAAYLADKYLLGESEDGWRRVQQAYQESDRAKFYADLRAFLTETGYVR